MAVAEQPKTISVEEYLQGELNGQVRHEYVAGAVYAMTGGSVYHNRISLNLAAELKKNLKGSPCDIFIADMQLQTEHAYYYPDLMVVCDPDDNDLLTKKSPILIAEILSPSTRSIDEREKRVAYQNLDSLQEYLMVEQDRPEVRLCRRLDNGVWGEQTLHLADSVVLQSLDIAIDMQQLYDDAWR